MSKGRNNELVGLPGINGNVAKLEKAQAPLVATSSGGSSGSSLGSAAYNPTLTGTVSVEAVIAMLRDGRKIGDNNSGRRHWFNYYLSQCFEKRFKKTGSNHLKSLVQAGMPLSEFYSLAKHYYVHLLADSRINFARVSSVGFDKLLQQSAVLSNAQWSMLFHDNRCKLRGIVESKEGFIAFFSTLSKRNQIQLRQMLCSKAKHSLDALMRYFSFFNVTSTEYNDISQHAGYQDIRLCHGNCDKPDEFMAFLNDLSVKNRITVILSTQFESFNRSEQGILSVVLNKAFSVEGSNVHDLMQVLSKLQQSAPDYEESRDRVIAKFGFELIRTYDTTLKEIKAGSVFSGLYRDSDVLKAVVAQCSNKKAYEDNKEENGGQELAYHIGGDFNLSLDNGVEEAFHLRFKEPSYKELLTTAREFSSRDPANAVATYCQAMNTSEVKSRSRQALIAANRAANRAVQAQLRGEQLEEETAELPVANNATQERREVRDVDPIILKEACTLALRSHTTQSYSRLIELFNRHYREATLDFASCRDKPGTLLALSVLERDRAALLCRNNQAYELPAFVTDPDQLMDLTRSGDVNISQLREAWANLRDVTPNGSAASLTAFSYNAYAFQGDLAYSARDRLRSLADFSGETRSLQLKAQVALLRLVFRLQDKEHLSRTEILSCLKFRTNRYQTGCGRFFHPPALDRDLKSRFINMLYSRSGEEQLADLMSPFSVDLLQPHLEQLQQIFPRPVIKEPKEGNKTANISAGVCLSLSAAGIALAALNYAQVLNWGSNAAIGMLAGAGLFLLVGVVLLANRNKAAAKPARLFNKGLSSNGSVFRKHVEAIGSADATTKNDVAVGARVHIPTVKRRRGEDPNAVDAVLEPPLPAGLALD